MADEAAGQLQRLRPVLQERLFVRVIGIDGDAGGEIEFGRLFLAAGQGGDLVGRGRVLQGVEDKRLVLGVEPATIGRFENLLLLVGPDVTVGVGGRDHRADERITRPGVKLS
jgi:hypothetical protein